MERSSKPVSRVTGHLKNDLILNRQLVQEIALSISRLIHSDLPTVPYNVAMANLFEVYHKELIQSDRDPKTIDRYWQIATHYQTWLGDREPSVATAKQFLTYLREQGYQPRSVILYYHALRPLFEFIGQPLKLKLRRPKTLPPYHDRGDIEALIRQAEKGLYHETERQRKRNTALILTLAYTGMRKSELLNLLVGDVDFNRRVIIIRQRDDFNTKNREDRVIPIAERLVVPLREQCAGKAMQHRVFYGLNARSVYRIVTGLARAAGIDGFHPHSLRHYFATQLVERKVNLRSVQQLLGHRDLNTTALYLDVSAEHLRAAVDQLDSSPVPQHLSPIG